MKFRVGFLAGAATDLLAIHAEISAFSESQAERFSLRPDRRLAQLSKFPELRPPFSKRFRRSVLGKFPYTVFHAVSGDRIFIHGIFHLQVNPVLIEVRLRP